MKRFVWLLLFIGCASILCDKLSAATYYVDITNGADTNSGTSKTSAWAHAPGMQTCSNICKSTTINAGDSIILRGGEDWGNANFTWNLPGGASGNPVYVGVDVTWFTGTAWTRPILDAGGIAIANNTDTMFWVPGNVTVDNFEIKGFYWSNSMCSGSSYGQCGIFQCNQYSGQVFEHLYIHGWTHAGTGSGSNNGISTVFTFGGNAQNTAHDNVIVGTDVAGDHSMNAFFNGPLIAYNNFIQQVSSGFVTSSVGGTSIIHDNYIWDIGPAYCNSNPSAPGTCTHENGYEDNGDTGLYFYNNVLGNESDGLTVWIAPNPGYSAYTWNNVIYNVHDNQVFGLASPVYNSGYCPQGSTSNDYCKAAGSFYVWNNTVECGDDSTQYDICQLGVGVVGSGATATLVDYENNHFISACSTSSGGCSANQGCASGATAATTCTYGPGNVVQTLATANAQGYSSSGPIYAFFPTKANGATIGAGISLATSANGVMATLGSTTTYACVPDVASASACIPAVPQVRSNVAGAKWDAGAYQFKPSQPPTNAGAIVQTP